MKKQTKHMKMLRLLAIAIVGSTVVSCSHDVSSSTGWDYNNSEQGGFQKVPFVDQETGPGLIMIEGGTFTMGMVEQDVMFDWNNRPARVTVSSFYIDQTEVTNFHWLEYLYWLKRSYENYTMVYKNALPDTLAWRSPLAFMEKNVDYYLRHPAYRDYPVVGVSWLQASDFCKWRTDRVNEFILVREGVLGWDVAATNEATFNTDAYLAGQFEQSEELGGKKFKNLDPVKGDGKKLADRIVMMEDGVLLPRYRLPTEAEWEFAAAGLIGNLTPGSEVISERRQYPWNGHYVRQDNAEFQGAMRANFVRGRGDYMGVAGQLNDGADVTAPVESFWPNDYGLYHMAGNVSEWVMDVYRPLTSEDYNEFRPFRGNVYQTKVLNNEGVVDAKNGQVLYDIHGMKEYLNEFERVRFQRISAANHDPLDTVIPKGIAAGNKAKHNKGLSANSGFAPDPFYVSHNNKKDSAELAMIDELNKILDLAIIDANDKYEIEANTRIQEEIFEGVFASDRTRQGRDEEYPFEIITMLREGFSEFIINTPGKLKYRNVTEEENIGRLNYRKDDYIDYLDGDIESSIYFNNDDIKNKINQASQDPKLLMYQSEFETYGLDGTPIKPTDKTSWPTTLISDKSRVYKGGSWKDRAYWLAVGTRRFLDEDKSTAAIGFRCAMDRVGSPVGQNYNKNKEKKK
jgi:gliding motility-associated lipoprotein GldJ